MAKKGKASVGARREALIAPVLERDWVNEPVTSATIHLRENYVGNWNTVGVITQRLRIPLTDTE
jgi:hypothetical protein